MAGGAKADVSEVGDIAMPSAKPSFKSRVAAHFKRWWWVHLIIFIAVVLIITLPVIYVGYPNIAQKDINHSTLEITSMVISDPATDSFYLNQTQVLGSDSVFHPKIFAFDAAVSLLGAAAFTTVRVPGIKANDGTVINVEQKVDLSNADAFGSFATAVMMNKEIDLNIYGRPELKQGGLQTITVTYNKTVTMKALNKLEGFKLKEMKVVKEQPDGTNARGKVFIPNPSVMTITMGNVTLDLSIEGTPIGKTYLDNLVLRPGDNNVDMRGNVSQLAVVPFLTKYKNNIVPVDITGNSSVYNGQQLPYFEAALSANKLSVDLDVASVFS